MKKNLILLLIALFAFGLDVAAQGNPSADPRIGGINPDKSPITVGEPTTVVMDFGNGGFNPIPANTVEWAISVPSPRVSVGALTFSANSVGFVENRRVTSGGFTIVYIRNTQPIPATTAIAPQDQYEAYLVITGQVVGTTATSDPTNISFDVIVLNPVLVGNFALDDDNATSNIDVIAPVPTPLRLLSFTAVKENKVSRLQWQTAMEQNTALFGIERSGNGIDFTGIGQVAAAGQSSKQQDYRFTDEHPLTGANYYRLEMKDQDGSSTYSKTCRLDFEDISRITLSPNPANDQVILDGIEKGVKVVMTDVQGKQVQSREAPGSSLTLRLDGLANGTYYVKVQSAGGNLLNTFKLVKK